MNSSRLHSCRCYCFFMFIFNILGYRSLAILFYFCYFGHNFVAILELFFSHSKFASIFFYRFFVVFLLVFKSSTLTKHCVGAQILKIGVFEENPKNLRKTLPKPSRNLTKILPKSIQNQKKSHQNATSNTDAAKKQKKWPKERPRGQHGPPRAPRGN